MTVVVLAQECDAAADLVVHELGRRGVPVFRADTAGFPQQLTLHARLCDGHWVGCLATAHHHVALQDIRSIWYRDPSAFRFPDTLAAHDRVHAFLEARLGLGGVLASLDVLWVNHPNRASDAIYKPHQLVTAARCGLRVPDTLVTNSPSAVGAFAATCSTGLVHKSFGANTVTDDGQLMVAFTRRTSTLGPGDLDGVQHTAHQFQPFLDKEHEARVIVVGAELFAVAIHAESPASRVDWRADFDALRYERVEPPAAVVRGLRAYMASFRLAYAAADFAVDTAGRWIFLEANTGGQYGFLEAATGAPITASLVDLLATGRA